jgi:heme-degrading monooxygenase HmoA
MMTIFATLTVAADRRREVAELMRARLDTLSPMSNGALHFELLLSVTDPTRIHVFQTWDSEATFKVWAVDERHVEFQKEFGRFVQSASAIKLVGCELQAT